MVVGIGILVAISSSITDMQDRRQRAAQTEEQRERTAALQEEWDASGDSLAGVARAALAQGEIETAHRTLLRFAAPVGARQDFAPLWDSIEVERRRIEENRRVEEILAELRGIPAAEAARNATLYEELVRLRPHNSSYRQRAAMYRERVGAQARRAFAQSWESSLLDQFMNVEIRVSGENATRVTMEYILVNRTWAHNMAGETLQNLRSLGFKRFTITDGYDETWYWDL